MATQEKSNRFTNPYVGMETMTQVLGDVVSFNLKTAQSLADQTMAMSRKGLEQAAVQMEQAAKIGQENMKYAMNLMEDYKKIVFEAAEKANQQNTPKA